MADIDWSNIPRLVIDFPFDPSPVEQVTITSWQTAVGTEIIPINTYFTGMFNGDQLLDQDGYPTLNIVFDLGFGELAQPAGTYFGDETGYEVVPHDFEFPPIRIGITSSESLQIVLLAGEDLPIEFWG